MKIMLKSFNLLIDGGDNNTLHLSGGMNPETDKLDVDLTIAAKLNGKDFNQLFQRNMEMLMLNKLPNNN